MKTIRCQSCLGRGVKRAFGNMRDEKCTPCNGSGGVTISSNGKATLMPTPSLTDQLNGEPEKVSDDPPKEIEIPVKPIKKTKKTKKRKTKKSK